MCILINYWSGNNHLGGRCKESGLLLATHEKYLLPLIFLEKQPQKYLLKFKTYRYFFKNVIVSLVYAKYLKISCTNYSEVGYTKIISLIERILDSIM